MSEAKFHNKEERGLYKLPIIINQKYNPNGTKSYASLLARYGFQPTKPGVYSYMNKVHQRGLAGSGIALGGRASLSRVLVKNSPADGGQLTAEDLQSDALYLCEVQIGTPPQKLRLELDTGSSEFWVFASGSSRGAGRTNFDAWRSSTFSCCQAKTWSMKRADGGSLCGEVGRDTVVVGGLEIKEQTIQLAKTLVGVLQDRTTSDGCMGLCIKQTECVSQNGAPDPQKTLVATMAAQAGLARDAQLFTTALCGADEQRQGGGRSFCTFGLIDQETVKQAGRGEVAWAPVDMRRGLWMVPSGRSLIGGQEVSRGGNQAAMDTNSPLVLVSDEVCDAFYAQIKGATYCQTRQGYLIPKSAQAGDLPELRLAVGEEEYAIRAGEHMFAAAGPDHWYGAVQSRGHSGFDVFGHPMLRSIYAIWDYGNSRFGSVARTE